MGIRKVRARKVDPTRRFGCETKFNNLKTPSPRRHPRLAHHKEQNKKITRTGFVTTPSPFLGRPRFFFPPASSSSPFPFPLRADVKCPLFRFADAHPSSIVAGVPSYRVVLRRVRFCPRVRTPAPMARRTAPRPRGVARHRLSRTEIEFRFRASSLIIFDGS